MIETPETKPQAWRERPAERQPAWPDKAALDGVHARLRELPPLVKGYLRAGCRIGDGAFVDRQFDTTDVFIYLPMKDMDPRYMSRFGSGT